MTQIFYLNPEYDYVDFDAKKLPFSTMNTETPEGVLVGIVFLCGFGWLTIVLGSEVLKQFPELGTANDETTLRTFAETVFVALFALSMFIMLLIGLAGYVRALRRYGRLRKTGVVLNGEVAATERKAQRRGYGMNPFDFFLRVEYVFQTPDGKTLRGDQYHERNDLRGEPLPAPGTPIRVLYADDHAYVIV